jgi:hypothetical protein
MFYGADDSSPDIPQSYALTSAITDSVLIVQDPLFPTSQFHPEYLEALFMPLPTDPRLPSEPYSIWPLCSQSNLTHTPPPGRSDGTLYTQPR